MRKFFIKKLLSITKLLNFLKKKYPNHTINPYQQKSWNILKYLHEFKE